MGYIMIGKQLVSNFVVNVKMTTIRRKLYIADLASELVALLCQSTLPCPRALIVNNLAPLPPRTRFAFDVFGSPCAVAFMRAKRAISIPVFKFVRLTKNRCIALRTVNYFSCSCFQPARCIAIFTWFLAGNVGKYGKGLSTIFARFHYFWLSCRIIHIAIVRCFGSMSSKMLAMAGSRGKRLNSDSSVWCGDVSARQCEVQAQSGSVA